MEGYFWRVTVPETGQSVIALIGVNQGPRGPWATVGLAGHPQGSLAVDAHVGAAADPRRLGAVAGAAFVADSRTVRVDLGPDHRLELEVAGAVRWPRRRLGGSSVFHSIPALNQYWHPWLLGGTASGYAVLAGERVELTGGQVYGEKNWGKEGFPDEWWWGQAHGFTERGATVAFAGGQVNAGRLRTEVTAVVVRLPGGRVLRWGNPLSSPVSAAVASETWRLQGRLVRFDGLWKVEIDASAPLGRAHVLPVPLPSEHRNVAGALEHLGGRMQVRVSRQAPRSRRATVVWEGVSDIAGLEHGSLALAAQEIAARGYPADATHAPPARSR
jgi:hypothetical protein